jgi:hypothetical protein
MKTSIVRFLIRRFNLAFVVAAVVASCMLAGCQKENFDENEIDVISQSKEYEEYIIANLQFYNELQNITGGEVKIGEIDGKSLYRTSKKDFNIELFDKIVDANNELMDKYPDYKLMDKNKKEKLFEIVSVKSKEIAKLLPIENTPMRLKGNGIENFAQYITTNFSNYLAAFTACFNFSSDAEIESGGIVLPAIFFIDKLATGNHMSMPWSTIVVNSNATSTFHYHPGGNPYPSPSDSIAVQAMQQFSNINCLTILTKDTTCSTGFSTHSYNFK